MHGNKEIPVLTARVHRREFRTWRPHMATSRWLIGALILALLQAAHADVHELNEFRYRRLMDHAEAAGYELDAERQIGNASDFGPVETTLEPAGPNLYFDVNEDQYLIELTDSM